MKFEDYMTAHQAAEVLSLSYHSLMRARRRGLIEGEQVGWQYFFSKEEVERYGKALAAVRGGHAA